MKGISRSQVPLHSEVVGAILMWRVLGENRLAELIPLQDYNWLEFRGSILLNWLSSKATIASFKGVLDRDEYLAFFLN